MNNLDIITTLGLSNEIGKLYINKSGYLCYRNEDNKEIVVTNNSDKNRPLHISELIQKLNNRRWNHPIRKVILEDDQGNPSLNIIKDNLCNMPENNYMDYEHSIYTYSGQELLSHNTENIEEIINNFNKMIENIRSDKNRAELDSLINNNTITIYNSSKLVIDLLTNSVSFNLVNPDSYTDTISLVGIEKKMSNSALSAIVSLNVSYSINDLLYEKSLNFTAFSFSEDKLNRNEFVNNYDDISIEFIDNTIRVFPNSNKVNECIINNCIVTYGNNQENNNIRN